MKRGFAFVELLVALAFLTLVGSVVYIYVIAPPSIPQKKEAENSFRVGIPPEREEKPPSLPTTLPSSPQPPSKPPATPPPLPPATVKPTPTQISPLKLPTLISGTCGSSLNSCTRGTFLDVTDINASYLWNCLGSNGGTTASCNLIKSPAASSNILDKIEAAIKEKLNR